MDQKRKQYQDERYLWVVYSAEYPSRNEIQVQKRFPDKSEFVEFYFLLQISVGYEKVERIIYGKSKFEIENTEKVGNDRKNILPHNTKRY